MARSLLILASLLLLIPALAAGNAAEQTKVMELKGKAPAWWTPEVRAAADAAFEQGKLLNPLTGDTYTPEEAMAAVQIPVGAPDYLFIRPGALSLGESGALCTYNFIYGAGTQIGLAGHCVGRVGERAYILSVPEPTIPLITVLGTVTSFRNGGVGDDWALVNINAQWHDYVDPNMAYLGGPSCSKWLGNGGPVKHAGHGIQTGIVGSVPRVGYAGLSNGNSFTGYTEVSGGDSGSAMIQVYAGAGCAMGAAAGVLTHCATLTGLDCLPIFWATDIRKVPAVVTTGLDPI